MDPGRLAVDHPTHPARCDAGGDRGRRTARLRNRWRPRPAGGQRRPGGAARRVRPPAASQRGDRPGRHHNHHQGSLWYAGRPASGEAEQLRRRVGDVHRVPGPQSPVARSRRAVRQSHRRRDGRGRLRRARLRLDPTRAARRPRRDRPSRGRRAAAAGAARGPARRPAHA